MPFKQELTGQVFQFTVGVALAQDETYTIAPEELQPRTRKFMPFNVVAVFNNSDEDIEIKINDGALTHRVFTKTQKTITNILARNIIIKNISSTTTTKDEITVEFQNEEPGADKFFQKLADSRLLRPIFQPGLR